MTIVCATNNPHKIKEFQRIFSPLGIEILSCHDLGFCDEIEETGATFEANARIKAETVARAINCPAFADDSGLMVMALGGEPGVYSARYGGDSLDDQGRRHYLLDKMKDIPEGERNAQFVCSICFYSPDGQVLTVTETCDGFIAMEESGEGGFGYDSLFVVGDKASPKTFAEMDAEEKDRISHRGKAVKAFLKAFNEDKCVKV